MAIQKIISGGQTGADRAGLDFALARKVPHGGFCPRGRRAEDGRIPDRYELQETPSAEYPARTRLNIEQSDATLVIVGGTSLGTGTKLTVDHARRLGKPSLVIYAGGRKQPTILQIGELRSWLRTWNPGILNVAGSRGSENLDVYDFTLGLLGAAVPKAG